MPTIPRYNQGATEEAGLNRAKKRVIGLMEQGILKLTEKPAVDLTNGKADSLAEDVIRQMEEISSILRQGNLLFEELGDVVVVESFEEAKKILKLVVIARKLTRRLIRSLSTLSKGISYLDLGVFADLQTAWKELGTTFDTTATYLTNIDVEMVGDEDAMDRERQRLARELAGIYFGADDAEREADLFMDEIEDDEIEEQIGRRNRTQANFQRIPNFEDMVLELVNLFYNVGEIMVRLKTNFNEARKQRVLPREAVAEEDAQSVSGGVFRKPIYRIGNNVMSSLYELDGLPRYI
jgi:hypothetical protein